MFYVDWELGGREWVNLEDILVCGGKINKPLKENLLTFSCLKYLQKTNGYLERHLWENI